MRSLLKWAGGKRWLLERYAHLLPDPATITAYREPFLGSGAVATHYIGRAPCVLSDKNDRLMAMYRGVRDYPDSVMDELRRLTYDRPTYEQTRRFFNFDRNAAALYIAAWFIYLNKTCFNGLYRENRRGEFNVPFGRYTNPTICDEETIRAWSKALATARSTMLVAMGWQDALSSATAGEFVFLDPPYVPASDTANFTSYTASGFGPRDQEQLGAALRVLDGRGVKWMLTNSAEAAGLYSKWNVMRVDVARPINSKGSGRGKVGEIIVGNYEMVGRMAA